VSSKFQNRSSGQETDAARHQPLPAESGATIVVADDTPAVGEYLARLLERDGHRVVRAYNGAEALEVIAREQPDVALLDVMMPERSGFDVCQAIKSDPATRLIPVVLVTALQNSEDRIRGIEAGADDFLSKPPNPHELLARIRSLFRLKRYTDELDSAQSVIMSLALTIEARDAYTDGHCQRLATSAVAVGGAIGLQADDVEALRRGGVLHDIGKVGVPDAVLLKPSRLTPAEFEVMKQHTVIGDRLCGPLRSLKRVCPIIRHHHERFDGSGYPDGLGGDDIPLLAQIMSVVDVFDALTTDRPYRAAMTLEDACEELETEVRRGWRRRDLVDAFITVLREQRGELPPQTVSKSTP
jgi:putative two-component system response regulator